MTTLCFDHPTLVGESRLPQAAMEAELTRLSEDAGLSDALQWSGAFYNVRTAGI
jgi:hypothetical protein